MNRILIALVTVISAIMVIACQSPRPSPTPVATPTIIQSPEQQILGKWKSIKKEPKGSFFNDLTFVTDGKLIADSKTLTYSLEDNRLTIKGRFTYLISLEGNTLSMETNSRKRVYEKVVVKGE